MNENILEIKGLYKRYRKDEWAIQDINIEIKKGEIVAFLGHNGAGKTTTMKCIMNLLYPQKGSITVKGINNNNEKVKNLIGYLPENIFIPPYYRVLEILDLSLYLRDVKGDEDKIKKYLEFFELSEYKDKRVDTLSKGNKQKVALILTILHNPLLYIWDEPSENLDPVIRKKVIQFVKEEKEKGKSFFISTHILTEIEKVAERVILIKEGKIIADKKVEDINKNETLEDFYIRCYQQKIE